MKTVADFKRALKVGVRIHTVYHTESLRDENGNVIRLDDGFPAFTDKDMGEATIGFVGSTHFAVNRIIKGAIRLSHCSFPAKSMCIIEDNRVTIYETHPTRGRYPILTYTL